MRGSFKQVASPHSVAGFLTLALAFAAGTRTAAHADTSGVPPRAESTGPALLAEANRLFEVGRARQARQIMTQLIAAAQSRGDLGLEADGRELLGSNLMRLGMLDEAERELGTALAVAVQSNDRTRVLRTRVALARCDIMRGRDASAARALNDLLGEVRGSSDPELEARALLALGLARYAAEPDSAQHLLEVALDLGRRWRLARLEAEILEELGMMAYQSGDHDRAIVHEMRAADIARTHSFRGEELGALARAGVVHADLDEYSRALGLQLQALSIAEEIASPRAVANVNIAIGNIHLELERPEEALLGFEAALDVVRELHAVRFEAVVLRHVARAQAALGREDDAAQALLEASRIAARVGTSLDVANLLHDRGLVDQRRGDLPAAQEHLQEALAALEPLSSPLVRADLECHLGEVLRLRGDYDHAAALLETVLQRAERFAHPVLRGSALEQQALLRRDQGDLAAADSLLAQAMDISESIRARLSGDELRVAYHGRARSLHAARIGVLYAMGEAAHARAFEVAERARARALLDVLGAARPDADTGSDAGLREREHMLTTRLGALQTELSRRASEEHAKIHRLDSLQTELAVVVREHRRARDEIAVRSPRYADLLGYRRPLDVEAVRSRVLLPGQVLLEYLVGEDESYVFLVAADRLRLCRLPIGAEQLEARVALFREAIHSESDSLQGIAAQLYQLLIGPVEGDLGPDSRLLVVADGPLFHLPFAALRDTRGFLVERHAIACAPSASMLDSELRAGSRLRQRSLLAVGNPSSFRQDELLASTRDVQGWRLGELPYAEEEVLRVSRHFRRARTLTREAATEEEVKSAIGRASHVHFATHGLLHLGEPLLSGLALAQDEDPAEDGFLQVFEILKLRLSAEVVVLSGCNTGLGRLANGEGVLGMTRAFLYAGACQLLISLWEIGDRSTVDLMDRFYEQLFDGGLQSDQALQAAQIAMLRQGLQVRDWAAFVLTGPAGPPTVGLGSNRRTVWLRAALTLTLLIPVGLGLAAALRRRKTP